MTLTVLKSDSLILVLFKRRCCDSVLLYFRISRSLASGVCNCVNLVSSSIRLHRARWTARPCSNTDVNWCIPSITLNGSVYRYFIVGLELEFSGGRPRNSIWAEPCCWSFKVDIFGKTKVRNEADKGYVESYSRLDVSYCYCFELVLDDGYYGGS